jgi:hypothetical protein
MTADPRIIKLSLEILAQVDQGTITLHSRKIIYSVQANVER